MIDASAGKVDDLHRRRDDGGGVRRIWEAHDAISVRNIKLVTDESHAERRVQIGDESRASIGDAIAVGVAQQNDLVGARHSTAGAGLEQPEEESLDAPPVVGALRSIRLGYKHVAIG